jgi:hypothetical protein
LSLRDNWRAFATGNAISTGVKVSFWGSALAYGKLLTTTGTSLAQSPDMAVASADALKESLMTLKWMIPIVTFLAAAATLATDGPKISIEETARTKGGIQFLVLIENLGPSSVFLEETREGSRDACAINIEQLQPDSSWVSIGPRRDIPATSGFELKPSTKVEKAITVIDPYVDLRLAPHKQYPIQGRHRASIRYFLSPQEWSDFKCNLRPEPRLVYSRAFYVASQ